MRSAHLLIVEDERIVAWDLKRHLLEECNAVRPYNDAAQSIMYGGTLGRDKRLSYTE